VVLSGVGGLFLKLWPHVVADLDLFLHFSSACLATVFDCGEKTRFKTDWPALGDKISRFLLASVLDGSPSVTRRSVTCTCVKILSALSLDATCRQSILRSKLVEEFATLLTNTVSLTSQRRKTNADVATNDYLILLAKLASFEDGAVDVVNSQNTFSFLLSSCQRFSSSPARLAVLSLTRNPLCGKALSSRPEFLSVIANALKDKPSSEAAQWAVAVVYNLAQKGERSKANVRQSKLNVLAADELERASRTTSGDGQFVDFDKFCRALFED
jgi:hypothetical protein